MLVMTSAYAHPPARTDRLGGGGEAGQPLGTGVFGHFFVAGNCGAALHEGLNWGGGGGGPF